MREATIQKILEVQKHPDADALDIVKVLGWDVVTKNNEFKMGDLVCYVEIDSILPEKPEFEFLRNKKFRVKTCRFTGGGIFNILSQGIVFPLSILPSGEYVEDQDVSELLAVKHYEKEIPIALCGLAKRNFPLYVPKTDEPRLQSYPEVLKEFEDLPCYFTVKCDGTSGTFSMKDGVFDVCSRNISYKESDTQIYWKMARKYDIENILKKAGNYAIQGEIVGPGIQKNRLCLKTNELFVFDVWDIDNHKYLDFDSLQNFCIIYDLPRVPIDYLYTFDFTMEQLIEMAKGFYKGTQNRREGIVVRPIIGKYSRILRRRLSVKILNNEFLEKDEK